MNLKSHLRVGALMVGLSLCGGALTSAHAAPVAGAAKTAKAEKGHKNHGAKLGEALGLTDAQKAQLKPIMEAQRTQMKAIKADTTLAPKDKKAKMKALKDANDTKINAVLTPDQQKKWADMKAQKKAERKAKGKDGKGGRNGGPQAPAPAL